MIERICEYCGETYYTIHKKADSAKKNAIVNGNLYINQEKTIHNMENQNHKKPKEK
jgi:rRNA processing protein Gar1